MKIAIPIITLFFFFQNIQSQNTVLIDPNKEHQTIEGWGVSLAWWANLAGGMSESTIDELANYAVNDLNFNVFRFNIAGGENPNCTEGDHFRKDGGLMPGYRIQHSDNQGFGTNNYENDTRQIKVMNKIASLRATKGDIITEMISYSPPWWMTFGLCSAGNVIATQENLRPEFIDDFADYLVSVSAGLNERYPNWNVSYLAPFNEPISGYWRKGGGQEGSAIYEATQAQILWRAWQKQQNYNFQSLGLVVADNTNISNALINLSNLNNNNPGEYNGVSKINVHSYGDGWVQKEELYNFTRDNGNKRIWQSETGPLNWSPPNNDPQSWWIRHYDMSYRLIEDLRNLKSTVWCDWQLMSIDDGWGMLHQSNWDENNPFKEPVLNKTRSFYCRKNFTNFIKVGYKIIDSNNGNTLAALSPDNKEIVFVVVNNSNSTVDYSIDVSKFSHINGFRTYRTSGSNSDTGEDAIEKTISSITEKGILSGNRLLYNAPKYSVTTFVINISGSLSSMEFNFNELKIFPNPFNPHCTFQLPRIIENGKLFLYDTAGAQTKVIENINAKEIVVMKDNLSSGVYHYKLIENSKLLSSGSLVIN